MKVIAGIPAYNEEKNIAKVITELSNVVDEIIVCNDGSGDMTEQIAERMGVVIVNHQKNLGYGAAIRSIFLKAREIDCDVLITFDADGQHRVDDILVLLDIIKKNQADIVIGSRFLNDMNTAMPNYRRIGIKTITKLTNFSTNSKITDAQSGFRAYNKKALNELLPSEFGMGVSTEILIKASKKGLKIIEVPITILYQGDTSTHNPVSHGISVFFSTMKFISIDHPLKFYGIPGMILLVIGLFFIVWTIQEFTLTRQIITNLSLIGIGATILGTMFLMTSVILYSIVNLVREQHK